ncbi:hypothetical protein BN2537_2899 [Streptomyces venezuelae]|nr:hypothetical protein BN2537_2899 [Streptomyces venezuelae]
MKKSENTVDETANDPSTRLVRLSVDPTRANLFHNITLAPMKTNAIGAAAISRTTWNRT